MIDPVPVNLGLFVKEPVAGRVKTRLARSIGDRAATDLYRAFVADTLTLALNSRARHCRIFHSGAPLSSWNPGLWSSALGGFLSEQPQSAGGLGERLATAFSAGPCPLLMLGTDSPDLPEALLASALEALDAGAELVLGAVSDGGVWCIGLDRPRPELLSGIPWSSPRTGEALRNRADDLGLDRVEVAPWYDCDLEQDLLQLAARLRDRPEGATMTRRALEDTSSNPD
jgi:rSAM/selenodomain-associated transferase 1